MGLKLSKYDFLRAPLAIESSQTLQSLKCIILLRALKFLLESFSLPLQELQVAELHQSAREPASHH